MFTPRKPNRLKNYNYSNKGWYFITISSKNFEMIFCRLITENGIYLATELSEVGEVVRERIEEMSHFYDDIEIEKYVIMPNHIHLIIKVSSEEIPVRERANERIPQFISTMKRMTNRKTGFNIWHRSYHDHVIRDEEDYIRICEYIDNNPLRWTEDKYYCYD